MICIQGEGLYLTLKKEAKSRVRQETAADFGLDNCDIFLYFFHFAENLSKYRPPIFVIETSSYLKKRREYKFKQKGSFWARTLANQDRTRLSENFH